MTTCAITIGYNNLPPGRQSGEFRDAVQRAVDATCHRIYSDGESVGSWQGEPERGHFWLVDVSDAEHVYLRGRLASIAHTYGQQAIGYTVHDPKYGPSYVEAG